MGIWMRISNVFFSSGSWINVETSTSMTNEAFNDISNMHINENLLLEAQKESPRTSSKSSQSDR